MKKKKLLSTVFLTFAMLLLVNGQPIIKGPKCSFAAFEDEKIIGTISGDVQEGVSISLTNVACGEVSLSDTTETEEDGSYKFSDAINGQYTVIPEKTGYTFSPESISVIVTNDAVKVVDFTSNSCVDDDCDLDAKIEELITHYYSCILGRAPDSGGLNYWKDEIIRLISLGEEIKEGFISMAQAFFNSQEYLDRDRDDEEFVTDLYCTLFNREPDSGGLNYWTNELAQGMSRNEVLDYFVNSPEFNDFMDELFD